MFEEVIERVAIVLWMDAKQGMRLEDNHPLEYVLAIWSQAPEDERVKYRRLAKDVVWVTRRTLECPTNPVF